MLKHAGGGLRCKLSCALDLDLTLSDPESTLRLSLSNLHIKAGNVSFRLLSYLLIPLLTRLQVEGRKGMRREDRM